MFIGRRCHSTFHTQLSRQAFFCGGSSRTFLDLPRKSPLTVSHGFHRFSPCNSISEYITWTFFTFFGFTYLQGTRVYLPCAICCLFLAIHGHSEAICGIGSNPSSGHSDAAEIIFKLSMASFKPLQPSWSLCGHFWSSTVTLKWSASFQSYAHHSEDIFAILKNQPSSILPG